MIGHMMQWSPRSQMNDLFILAKGLLTAAPLTATEKLVMDKFLRSLPYKAKKLASKANPQSADQLVEFVEGHQAAVEVVRSGCPLRGEPNPRPKERIRPGTTAGSRPGRHQKPAPRDDGTS